MHTVNMKKISETLKKRLEKSEEDIKNGNYKKFKTAEEMLYFFKERPFHRKVLTRIKFFYEDYISPRSYYYRIVNLVTRLKWGFPSKDVWNFHYEFCRWAVVRLKRLKEIQSGSPLSLINDEELIEDYEKHFGGKFVYYTDNDDLDLLWQYTIQLMIDGFEREVKGIWDSEHQAIADKGMKYFSRYYRDLWT